MVDDVVDIVRLELMQNRHDDGSVCHNGQEAYPPVRTVPATDCDFVSLPDATGFKDDVKLFYFAGYVFILQGSSFVIGQCIQVPVALDAAFYKGDKTLFHGGKLHI